jgi:hypothetical protein
MEPDPAHDQELGLKLTKKSSNKDALKCHEKTFKIVGIVKV